MNVPSNVMFRCIFYNTEHQHSGIGFLPPGQLHHRIAKEIVKERQEVLKRAFETYLDRIKRGIPKPMDPPEAVWLNRPTHKSDLVLHYIVDGSVSFRLTHSVRELMMVTKLGTGNA